MPDDISELKDICGNIADDMRNRYTIGYVPSDRDFSRSVRRIKVTASAADRGKLKVRTRALRRGQARRARSQSHASVTFSRAAA